MRYRDIPKSQALEERQEVVSDGSLVAPVGAGGYLVACCVRERALATPVTGVSACDDESWSVEKERSTDFACGWFCEVRHNGVLGSSALVLCCGAYTHASP